MLPDKIGGRQEEDGHPGVLIALGSVKKPKMPAKIGGTTDGDEPEGEDESISNEQAMDDAVSEILSAVGGSQGSAKRLKSALKAFFYACDAEPHDEGAHNEEEGDE